MAWVRRDRATVRVVISQHALDRFIERVRPGLSPGNASRELHRLIESFGVWSDGPEWLDERAEQPDYWLRIGDDLWLACARVSDDVAQARTVIVNGGLSEKARAKRNQQRSRHRKSYRVRGEERAQIAERRE